VIPKLAAGYVHFPSGEYDCDDCPFWLKGNRCVLHGPDDDLLAHDACNYMVLGVPGSLGDRPMGYLRKDQSGFVRSVNGFSCRRCRFFNREANACSEVDKDSPGDDPGSIQPKGCCNLWKADPVYGAMTEEQLDKKGSVAQSGQQGSRKQGPDVERSRGIADITLSPEGKRDVDQLGRDLAKRNKVNIIFTSPLWRCIKTAQAIQKYSPSAKLVLRDALMTWGYGGDEGGPAKITSPHLLRMAKDKPNEPVPGVGPISGARGHAFNEWKRKILTKGFLPIMRHVQAHPEQVVAVVCHSRDIYTLEGWIAAGMPKSLAIDFKEMEHGSHPPGDVSTITYKPSGVWDTRWVDLDNAKEDLGKDKPEGIIIRHGKTNWN
jgi:broad specificity phosphatase PhoE